MDNLKALVIKNEAGLEESQVRSLIDQLNKRQISYLSPDKESGPFLLYAMGDSLEDISLKTGYPKEIVLLTAIYYKWNTKAVSLGLASPETTTQAIMDDIKRTLLLATSVSLRKQLGDVIAGRVDASKMAIIPKNIQSLKAMMEMIEGPKGKETGTNISAQNVQIINNTQKTGRSKIESLKLIAAQKKQNA